MVSFYKPGKKSKPLAGTKTVYVHQWDMQGQGVCKDEKPVLFVDGALPGETVSVTVTQSQKNRAKASVKKVVDASASRVMPFCDKAKRCGGCQLQHVNADDALQWRQQAISSYWQKQLGVSTIPWQPPVKSTREAYRRKARLAVDVRNVKQPKIGYREASGNQVVDIDTCPVLVASLQSLILPLKQVLLPHPATRHLGHVSLLAGDNVASVALRFTRPPSQSLQDALKEFACNHGVNMQWEHNEKVVVLHEAAPLRVTTEGDLFLSPSPNDFVQVNKVVNQRMIEQAMAWLSPKPGERIADWFSGLGNFSLSLAKRGASVFAVEGVANMVERAKHNALKQGISSIDWAHRDLFDQQAIATGLRHGIDKVLIDPSREGALAVCEALAEYKVKSILYVSCNPSTLTRDIRCLLDAGYHMEKVGLIEMFPQTRHLEMMMLFTDNKNTRKAS